MKTFAESNNCLYYAAQFIGQDTIMAGGSNKNIFKVKDRRTGVDVGDASGLSGGVFCCDQRYIRVLYLTLYYNYTRSVNFKYMEKVWMFVSALAIRKS